MLTVFHKYFEIEVSTFINQQGNTSYMLDVFDYSKGGVFVYRLIRYHWGDGSSNYVVCRDSSGWRAPYAVRVKDLLDGFNWSCVRRAMRDLTIRRKIWFSNRAF